MDDVRQSQDRLTIALLAPPWFRIPPDGYGGIEVVVAELADTLLDRGHHVTVVGLAGNGLRAPARSTYREPQGDRLGDVAVEVAHLAQARQVIAELRPDVVHDHTLAGPLLAPSRSCPTVVTAHGPVTADIERYFTALSDCIHLVSISDSQRASTPHLPWLSTVYNAVSVDDYPFRDEKEDYVLFLGRCCPEKGVDTAIQVARAAGRRLVIAMKCSEPQEQAFFTERVKPLLGDDTDYIGEVAGDEKLDLIARASALLCPVRWDEPFGLVAIESMACGTPVVALRRGAFSETVQDGVTGVLTDDAADLPRALDSARYVDPTACRERVASRFSPQAMAEGYERAYRQALARRGDSARPSTTRVLHAGTAPQLVPAD